MSSSASPCLSYLLTTASVFSQPRSCLTSSLSRVARPGERVCRCRWVGGCEAGGGVWRTCGMNFVSGCDCGLTVLDRVRGSVVFVEMWTSSPTPLAPSLTVCCAPVQSPGKKLFTHRYLSLMFITDVWRQGRPHAWDCGLHRHHVVHGKHPMSVHFCGRTEIPRG